MTRDEIKKLFPEATDEQVSALLSSHHSEMNRLKDDNKALKEKADKFDEAEREKLSQEEKLNKLIEEANKAKAENQRLLNRTKAAAKFTAAGLSEEEYSTVLDDFVSDNEEQTIGFAETLAHCVRNCRASRGGLGCRPNLRRGSASALRQRGTPLWNPDFLAASYYTN